MSKMLYGDGGLQELPTTIEQRCVEAAVVGFPLVVLGDVTSGSPIITNVADTSKVKVGEVMGGLGLPAGSTVLSKTSTSVTLDSNSTLNGTQQPYVQMTVNLGVMAGAKVMLFTDEIAYPIKPDVLADLTPAAFAGYAVSSAVSWGAPFQDLNNNVFVTGDKKQFLCTADTPDTPAVTGAALVSNDGLTLLAVDIFLGPDGLPAPVAIEDVGDALDYVPTFGFAPVQ